MAPRLTKGVLVEKKRESEQRREENGRTMSMKPSFLAERYDPSAF
jgi:hypothetical protein